MCTVTFFPLADNGFLLTSNRDERTTRLPATPPNVFQHGDHQLIYPGDPQGRGTWIAADNQGNAVCLLNGANKPHKPDYPYRHSRGLVVTDFFTFDNIHDFIDLYDLSNIEPFTLVIIHDRAIYEFRWDGTQRFLKNHKFTEPGVWSSVTLYNEEIIKKREFWYQEWIRAHRTPGQEDIIQFHLTAGEGNKKTDVMMKREPYLRTISITSVKYDSMQVRMIYKDMVNRKRDDVVILARALV